MSKDRQADWNKQLLISLALIAAGGLVGWALGSIWLGTTLVLAGLLARTLFLQYQVDRWLHKSPKSLPPEVSGLWESFISRVDKRFRKERKRRRSLHRVIRQFRDASNAMPDGLLTLDNDDNIAWFNDGAERLLGLRRPRDFNQPITNLIRNPRFNKWLADEQGYGDKLSTHSPLDVNEKLIYRCVPLAGGQRILVVRDVTMLQRLDDMRRDFVANVSHELRTPLTVLAGYIEAMDGDPPKGWDRAIAQMATQTNRMTELVEDLLIMARLDSKGGDQELERVDVPSLVAGLAEEALHQSEIGHQVETDITTNMGLKGVHKDLRIAFGNLLTNAVRYSPPQSIVSVEWCEDEEGHYRFSVTDEGPGIPAKHLPRLTERFYRVDPGRARTQGGTGLGLAITKHIVTQHGGELQIESEVGVGSVFSCVFPAERAAPPQVDGASQQSA